MQCKTFLGFENPSDIFSSVYPSVLDLKGHIVFDYPRFRNMTRHLLFQFILMFGIDLTYVIPIYLVVGMWPDIYSSNIP